MLISFFVICTITYLGAERGSYQASYYWAKLAEERKAKKDAEIEQRKFRDAAELRALIAKGLDRQSKDRWDKYDQCIKLGAVKAGQPGAGELVLSAYIPTWMQYCLTGGAGSPKNNIGQAPPPQ
jgi:hypothetical protein